MRRHDAVSYNCAIGAGIEWPKALALLSDLQVDGLADEVSLSTAVTTCEQVRAGREN